ncbi:hypothetical protein ACFWIA_14175 [Streptomyces sp. NPDC127068]
MLQLRPVRGGLLYFELPGVGPRHHVLAEQRPARAERHACQRQQRRP